MKDRTNQILELLSESHRIEVTELARILGVSQVTVRKDLDALEQKKIIRREHGYALLRSTDDINGRIACHYDAKRRIAARACELVRDGDTLFIESGSCCAILADLLYSTRKNITIVTNSAFIADYIRRNAAAGSNQTILLGGIYQPDSQALVGPMISQLAAGFFVNRFFIGTDGYTPRTGFTNCDQMRAQAVRDMSRSADGIIVLTESDKFGKHGVIRLDITDHVRAVITDDALPAEMEEELLSHQIKVIKT